MTSTGITSRRLLLAAATLLLGAATAWFVARSHSAFEDVLAPVQLAMSVLVPFFGVLMVQDVRLARDGLVVRDGRVARDGGPPPGSRPLAGLGPAVGLALGLAVCFALAGVLLTAAGTGWPSAARVAALVAASVLVQLIAQLVGTGCGLLIRRPGRAMAATVAVPMGVTIVLGVLDPGGGLVRWLTPVGNARSLLAGTPTAALLLVPLLWCVVPNVLGARHRVAIARAASPGRAA